MGITVAVALLQLAIGALLAFIGAARPPAVWRSAKVHNLVARVGESGARAVFFGLAAVNLAGAAFSAASYVGALP